jgi:hypothetical protein
LGTVNDKKEWLRGCRSSDISSGELGTTWESSGTGPVRISSIRNHAMSLIHL